MPEAKTLAVSCSFCGKPQDQVDKVIAGPGVYICNECVDLCNQILSEQLGLKEVHDELQKRAADAGAPPQFKDPEEMSDTELLSEMVRIHRSHDQVDRAVAEVVQRLRQRGMSWARLGEALGMTRQSAWERFSGEE